MITKLPPVGFKILQISLQMMHHFFSRLYWPLVKVHFAGHAHVELVLDVGMWVTDWECGSLVTNYPRATSQRLKMGQFKIDNILKEFHSSSKDHISFMNSLKFIHCFSQLSQ